jgi:hypothetical protein
MSGCVWESPSHATRTGVDLAPWDNCSKEEKNLGRRGSRLPSGDVPIVEGATHSARVSGTGSAAAPVAAPTAEAVLATAIGAT